jgi:hypothetical protein
MCETAFWLKTRDGSTKTCHSPEGRCRSVQNYINGEKAYQLASILKTR